MKLAPQLPFPKLNLNRELATALHTQLYQELKQRILDGKILVGARLPSSRALAKILRLSRNTTLNAYEQLLSEGYLSAKVGQGTRVSENLPEEYLVLQHQQLTNRESTVPLALNPNSLLERSRTCRGSIWKKWKEIRPFRTGVPPLDLFPMKTWCRLLNEAHMQASKAQLAYGSGLGFLPLRQAIAEHLAPARGIKCKAENVIIFTSSHHAIDLCLRALSNSSDSAYFENPGYPGARYLFQLAGIETLGLEIDSEGLVLPQKVSKKAKLLFCTPSHQFPTGVVMSLERRMSLLAWAKKYRIAIIEDDYSGEYRFREHPLPALKALDNCDSVFYIGTFSKVTFPAIRVGYLVIPENYSQQFEQLLSLLESAVSTQTQIALTKFIKSGLYERHLKKVREVAFKRKNVLLKILERELPSAIKFLDSDAGMHVLLELPASLDDTKVSEKLIKHGVQSMPLSACCIDGTKPAQSSGLILHYAGFSESSIKNAAQILCAVLT